MHFRFSGTFNLAAMQEPLSHVLSPLGHVDNLIFSREHIFQELASMRGDAQDDVHCLFVRMEDLLSEHEKMSAEIDLRQSLSVLVDELLTAIDESPFIGRRVVIFTAPSTDVRENETRYRLFLDAERKLVARLEVRSKIHSVSHWDLLTLHPVTVLDARNPTTEQPYSVVYLQALALGTFQKLQYAQVLRPFSMGEDARPRRSSMTA